MAVAVAVARFGGFTAFQLDSLLPTHNHAPWTQASTDKQSPNFPPRIQKLSEMYRICINLNRYMSP